MSKSRKYGLHAERTTLCAVNVQLSQASVTSTKSWWSLRLRNELRMLKWKSFHLSEYCCSPPLDEDEEAAMASVPLGLTTRGAIVFSPRHSTFKHLHLSFSSLVSELNCLNALWMSVKLVTPNDQKCYESQQCSKNRILCDNRLKRGSQFPK